jgi:hypothetical protein
VGLFELALRAMLACADEFQQESHQWYFFAFRSALPLEICRKALMLVNGTENHSRMKRRIRKSKCESGTKSCDFLVDERGVSMLMKVV